MSSVDANGNLHTGRGAGGGRFAGRAYPQPDVDDLDGPRGAAPDPIDLCGLRKVPLVGTRAQIARASRLLFDQPSGWRLATIRLAELAGWDASTVYSLITRDLRATIIHAGIATRARAWIAEIETGLGHPLPGDDLDKIDALAEEIYRHHPGLMPERGSEAILSVLTQKHTPRTLALAETPEPPSDIPLPTPTAPRGYLIGVIEAMERIEGRDWDDLASDETAQLGHWRNVRTGNRGNRGWRTGDSTLVVDRTVTGNPVVATRTRDGVVAYDISRARRVTGESGPLDDPDRDVEGFQNALVVTWTPWPDARPAM